MSENIQQTVVEQSQQSEQPEQPEQPKQPQIRLVDVEVINQNVALNVIMSFITLAQQRGAFNIQESAKIWECIKMFKPDTNVQAAAGQAAAGQAGQAVVEKAAESVEID